MKQFLALDAQSLNFDKSTFAKLRVSLKKKTDEFKFVDMDKLCIPLVHLSEIDIDPFKDKIHSIAQGTPSFDLKLSGLSAYPDLIQGRMIWIGVQNTKELRELQSRLEALFYPESEQEYKPTLPLVRMRNHHNVADALSPYKSTKFPVLNVQKIILYEMTSGGAYPAIKPVLEFALTVELP